MKISIKQIEDGKFLMRCNAIGEYNHVFAAERLNDAALWVGRLLLAKYYLEDEIKDHEMLEITADDMAVPVGPILEM